MTMTREEMIKLLKALLVNPDGKRVWVDPELIEAVLRELRVKGRAETQIIYNFLAWLPVNVYLVDDHGSKYGEDWNPIDDAGVHTLLNDWCDPDLPPRQVATAAEAVQLISTTGATITKTAVKHGRLQFITDQGEVHVRERMEKSS